MQTMLTNKYISISDLKINLSSVINSPHKEAIAILSHNKPKAYLLSTKDYEEYLKYKREQEILNRAKQMASGQKISLTLSELDKMADTL